jgi:tetratricopeptide (TPR) repeat protein
MSLAAFRRNFSSVGVYVATLIGLVLTSSVALADAAELELARRRFATGQLLYEQGRYDEALAEMKAARAALDKPQFDYNIGLCLEKLGHASEAADAFERFVRALPNDPEAPRIWQRIAELRVSTGAPKNLRSEEPVPTPMPIATPAAAATDGPSRSARTPLVKRWWLWTAVAGAAVLAGAAIGLGIGLSDPSRYPATMPTDGTVRF